MKFFNFELGIEITSLVVLIISFLLVYFLTPKLIDIVRYINTMDSPDGRSSHKEKTPNLGGILFYASLIFSLYIIHYYDSGDVGYSIILGITILFLVGLKDDLMVLAASTKLIAQIFAVVFVLMNPELYIFDFQDIQNVPNISVFLSILIGGFIMIFIINAYNLIDGIDGLASMLGIFIFSVYAVLFCKIGLNFYSLISITSIGFLIGFLPHNLSKSNKIFMGDTGSMIVGFIIGLLTIRFLSVESLEFEQIQIYSSNKIIITLAILFFPVTDVARVIIMRLINKRDPFKPDRCHMHHILIDKGLTHLKASITLTICGLIIFFVIYLFNQYLSTLALSIVFVLWAITTFSILLLLDSDSHASTYRKRFKALFPRRIQIIEFRIRKKIIVMLKKVFYKNML